MIENWSVNVLKLKAKGYEVMDRDFLQVQPGDRVLLCSDGLSDPVTRETIEIALGDGTPEMAAQRLVELALRSGGPDNVTVVVAEVVEAAEGDAAAETRAVVKAGALDPGYESSHPDSAASRAAASTASASAMKRS